MQNTGLQNYKAELKARRMRNMRENLKVCGEFLLVCVGWFILLMLLVVV